MNAIISVVGKDAVGILAAVSEGCAKFNSNVIEVSQTVIKNYFTMVMIVNIDNLKVDFTHFVDEVVLLGKEKNLNINVMHEDIFNLMHKI